MVALPLVAGRMFYFRSRLRKWPIKTPPDPESPEWNVGWTIKRALRLHLGPRHSYLPWMIAREVVSALRLSNWHITKGPPRPPHSTPGE